MLVKNGRELWDQDFCFSTTGGALHTSKEAKLKLKFMWGKDQKRTKGKSLWNKEGMSFF
jgi:hypothetical protein